MEKRGKSWLGSLIKKSPLHPCKSLLGSSDLKFGKLDVLNSMNFNVGCMIILCHVRVSELNPLYSCLNVKELLDRSRDDI